MKKKIIFIIIILILGIFLLGCTEDNPDNNTSDQNGPPHNGPYCGDGECDSVEQTTGMCPEDCNGNEPTPPNDSNTTYNNSPFGILAGAGSFSQISEFITNMGVRSIRYGGIQGVDWNQIEYRMGPNYPEEFQGWGNTDKWYKDTYDAGIEMSVIITTNENPTLSETRLNEYAEFVRQAVERYDGDGIDDAPGSPIVTYWEIDNEPDILPQYEAFFFWKGDMDLVDDYALMLKTAYKAVKSANPNAKVAIGALGTRIEYHRAVLEELEKLKDSQTDQFFDVFNFHVYGDLRSYGRDAYVQEGAPDSITMTMVNELLAEYGYSGIETIVTESGTQTGNGTGQTQSDQAISLLKRYVYLISEGLDRLYWFNLLNVIGEPTDIDIDGFPSHTLIRYDSENNTDHQKRLGYYTYKLMTEKLEGSDWDNASEIYNNDNVYAYKFTNKSDGSVIYVAWWDYYKDPSYSDGDTKEITLSELGFSGNVTVTDTIPKYVSGTEVIDYSSAFNTWTTSELIDFGKTPVYIEQN